jgi:hypothetical protein
MAAMKRTKKMKRGYIVVGVQGKMMHNSFLGVRPTAAQAVDDANQYYLHTGNKARVLEVDSSFNGTTETFKSNG